MASITRCAHSLAARIIFALLLVGVVGGCAVQEGGLSGGSRIHLVPSLADEAQARVKAGDFSGGIHVYSQIIEIQPTVPAWRFVRAVYRDLNRDHHGAVDDYRTAVRLETVPQKIAQYRWHSTDSNFYAGNYDAAMADLTAAQGFYRDGLGPAVSLIWMGKIHIMKGDWSKARDQLETCLRVLGRESTAARCHVRAIALLLLNRTAEALAESETALSLDTGANKEAKSEALMIRGFARERSGMRAASDADFHAASNAYPTFYAMKSPHILKVLNKLDELLGNASKPETPTPPEDPQVADDKPVAPSPREPSANPAAPAASVGGSSAAEAPNEAPSTKKKSTTSEEPGVTNLVRPKAPAPPASGGPKPNAPKAQ